MFEAVLTTSKAFMPAKFLNNNKNLCNNYKKITQESTNHTRFRTNQKTN